MKVVNKTFYPYHYWWRPHTGLPSFSTTCNFWDGPSGDTVLRYLERNLCLNVSFMIRTRHHKTWFNLMKNCVTVHHHVLSLYWQWQSDRTVSYEYRMSTQTKPTITVLFLCLKGHSNWVGWNVRPLKENV